MMYPHVLLCNTEARTANCPNDCSKHGVCAYGLLDEYGRSLSKCVCLGGWTGEDCSINVQCKALDYCSGHGSCANEECICDCGYDGEKCDQVVVGTEVSCPDDCNGNGECIMGQCYCHPGYNGEGCEIATGCINNCNGRGQCKWGKCFCDVGYGFVATTRNDNSLYFIVVVLPVRMRMVVEDAPVMDSAVTETVFVRVDMLETHARTLLN